MRCTSNHHSLVYSHSSVYICRMVVARRAAASSAVSLCRLPRTLQFATRLKRSHCAAHMHIYRKNDLVIHVLRRCATASGSSLDSRSAPLAHLSEQPALPAGSAPAHISPCRAKHVFGHQAAGSKAAPSAQPCVPGRAAAASAPLEGRELTRLPGFLATTGWCQAVAAHCTKSRYTLAQTNICVRLPQHVRQGAIAQSTRAY